VRHLEARVGKRVGVVPLDPHLLSLSPALHRDPHHGPASLEHAVTPDHEVPNAELSHESASGLPLPLPSFRKSGTRKASNIPRNETPRRFFLVEFTQSDTESHRLTDMEDPERVFAFETRNPYYGPDDLGRGARRYYRHRCGCIGAQAQAPPGGPNRPCDSV